MRSYKLFFLTKRLLSLIFIVIAMQSCAGNVPVANTSVQKELMFFDSDIFDQNLSSSLGSGSSEITAAMPDESVKITEKFPQRLDKWLYMVKTNKGQVKVEPDPASVKTKGIPIWIKDVLVGVYDAVMEKIMYAPAKNYDATLYYDKASGKVTKVVFTKKQ